MPIYFKPIAAEIQKKDNSFFKLDPYLVGYIGSEKFRSQTHRDGDKKPRWNSQYSFYFQKVQQIMRVQLWDQKTFDDQLIGEGNINLGKILKHPKTKKQYSIPLFLHGKRAGKIICLLEYQGLPIHFAQEFKKTTDLSYGQRFLGSQNEIMWNHTSPEKQNWMNFDNNRFEAQQRQMPFFRTANNQAKSSTPIHNLYQKFYSPAQKSLKINWNYYSPRANRNYQATV